MQISEKEVQQFAAFLREEEKSTATIEKYSREAGRFSAWLSGRELSKDAAREYKEMLTGKRAPAGVNGAVAALNCLFDMLGRPECRLKSVRIQRRVFRDESRDLTEEEYRRLLKAAKARHQHRLLLVMETICSTGIRVGELKYFTVEAVRRGWADVTNKGKVRTVFLPHNLQKLLLKYARKRNIQSGIIFVTRFGNPLDRSNIWHDMKALCAAAGVAESKAYPHNLRHLFAKSYYELEKDIVRLADVLGHSNVNTTRVYTMETGDACRKQLERLKLTL